jgi:hypothetical protein
MSQAANDLIAASFEAGVRLSLDDDGDICWADNPQAITGRLGGGYLEAVRRHERDIKRVLRSFERRGLPCPAALRIGVEAMTRRLGDPYLGRFLTLCRNGFLGWEDFYSQVQTEIAGALQPLVDHADPQIRGLGAFASELVTSNEFELLIADGWSYPELFGLELDGPAVGLVPWLHRRVERRPVIVEVTSRLVHVEFADDGATTRLKSYNPRGADCMVWHLGEAP